MLTNINDLSENGDEESEGNSRIFNGDFEWDNLGTEVYKTVEKRPKPDSSGNDEDGFTLVTKRNRPSSGKSPITSPITTENLPDKTYDVCITSIAVLPKNIALAKLLRSNNISGIKEIKYKGPYKVIIKFNTKENADLLINSKSFQNLDFRFSYLNELNLSYGLIRRIDLEVGDGELLNEFKSDQEIISIKRLQRVSDDGQWVDCESMRICFKGSSLPQYVYAYGCRFKVDKYTFPVSQCSGCWKYGHFVRICPTKKVVCPKCGLRHSNCETTEYKCVNCSGSHMANCKTCPVFIKEKTIREIMSNENCTYRKALELHINRKEILKNDDKYLENENQIRRRNYELDYATPSTSYRDAVISMDTINQDTSESEDETTEIYMNKIYPKSTSQKEKKKLKITKNKTINKDKNTTPVSDKEKSSAKDVTPEHLKELKGKIANKFDLLNILKETKEIIFSDRTFEEKVQLIIKMVLREIVSYFMGFIKECNLTQNIFSNYGL